jgi:hypothetical protein
MDTMDIMNGLNRYFEKATPLQLREVLAFCTQLTASGCPQADCYSGSKKRKKLHTATTSNCNSPTPYRLGPQQSTSRQHGLSLTYLSVYVSDVISCVLFSFLDLRAHFRLARTCRALLSASGTPPPVVSNSRGW